MHGFIAVDLLREFIRHGGERLEGEIGVDRLRAIAGEQREMMHLARLAGLDDEADRGAQTLADQMMMHGGGREQRRDRNAVRPDEAVGQDDDVVAAAHRLIGALAEPRRAPRAMPSAPRSDVIGDVERLGVESFLDMADRADFFEIAIGQDRLARPRGACGVECPR